MNSKLKRAALLASSTIPLLVACDQRLETPITAPPNELAVSLVLSPSEVRQKLLLTKVAAVNASRYELITDAEVIVNGILFQTVPSDSVDPRGYGYYNYNYYSELMRPVAGEACSLTIRTATHEVSGWTRVPGDFTIEPNKNSIRWTHSSGSSFYRISFERPNSSVGGWSPTGREYAQRDTLLILVDDPLPSGTYRVTIEAFDKNIELFTQKKSTRAGINEGYGVFGSVLRKRAVIVLP